MIEINLLPGAKRSKGGGGLPSFDFAAIGAAISARIKDKWLAAAVIAGIAVGVGIGFLFTAQQARQASLNSSVEKAVADSVRYAAVLNDRIRAEARRDSALIQLNIIKAIDEDRFVWPHVLQEVSEALPQYTWLSVLAHTGTPQGVNPPAAFRQPPPDTSAKGRRRRVEPKPFPKDTVRMRLVGRTVDIQAMTRFMRSLEDSPFLGSVQLQGSEIAIENGKEVTQFTLEVLFTRPDTTFLRRAPLTVTQR
jgi:Tfp pilus assembly protein PilN